MLIRVKKKKTTHVRTGSLQLVSMGTQLHVSESMRQSNPERVTTERASSIKKGTKISNK